MFTILWVKCVKVSCKLINGLVSCIESPFLHHKFIKTAIVYA